jgi:hypothetical protein
MNAYQRWLLWSGFLLGGIILFWLPIEDVNLTAATILSAAVCFWIALALTKRWQIDSRNYIWMGFISGLLIGPVGFLLMVFKIGFHNHNASDFSFDQLFRFVEVSPVWGISGFLLGWGVHLYHISRSQ